MDIVKMYWEDPYDTEFCATVTEIWQEAGQLFVVLDRTLFYPEGGGQPSDQGIILPVASAVNFEAEDVDHTYTVVRVFEEDGRVVHVICSQGEDILSPGQTVCGKVDWGHRFDLMQQHTGQHILSRAFEEVCGAKTVGFHLGVEYVSIDLDVPSVEENLLVLVEDLANEIVFKNLHVQVKDYEQAQVPPNIRRRIPTDSAKIRVVYVGDFDACACGGTHVEATGEVGIIKINQIERAHAGVRVLFRCGRRALRDLREKEKVLFSTAQALSVSYRDLYEAVVLQAERSNQVNKELQVLKKDLVSYEIRGLIEEVNSPKNTNLGQSHGFFVKRVEGKDIPDLKIMCRSVAEATNNIVVLFSCAPRFSLVVACPASGSMEPEDVSASAIVEKLAEKWGIRGGGASDIAQMGSRELVDKGEDEVREELLEILDELSKKS